MHDDSFLEYQLNRRREEGSLRELKLPSGKTDFCSNDYLGMVHNKLLQVPGSEAHGSTGSRLLAGNSQLAEALEATIARFHDSEAALLFNSGYDANVGLLSCIPQKGDTVIYDALSHASIRDGIRLNHAAAFSFRHNDIKDLEKKILVATGQIFVITESLFSMDGDIAPLNKISAVCDRYKAHLIVDEAHATGIYGPFGAGLVQEYGLQLQCFARIHTFGKALGCHGAVVLGSHRLRSYLVNFARSFIYTTALPAVALRAIEHSYQLLPGMEAERHTLTYLIHKFTAARIAYERIPGNSPIQGVIVPGNEAVKALSARLEAAGFDVRPIMSPTVPKGAERLRIVLHSFNTPAEVNKLIALLQ